MEIALSLAPPGDRSKLLCLEFVGVSAVRDFRIFTNGEGERASRRGEGTLTVVQQRQNHAGWSTSASRAVEATLWKRRRSAHAGQEIPREIKLARRARARTHTLRTQRRRNVECIGVRTRYTRGQFSCTAELVGLTARRTDTLADEHTPAGGTVERAACTRTGQSYR